jgi:hypothetical protein
VELAEIQAYAAAFKTKALAAVKANKGPAGAAGAFVDSCWVHEQNVEYCHNQGAPNCVGEEHKARLLLLLPLTWSFYSC